VDNWFTSIKLVEKLKGKGLTYVGTIQNNRREIPNDFAPSKGRKLGFSLYGFSANMTLVSHVPKRNKAICLVSSMNYRVSVSLE
jgi:hypothetical protein